MKKSINFLLCLILVVSSVLPTTFAAYKPDIDIESEIALLISLDTDAVIISKNADKRSAPASLTKIVTAAVALENCNNLDKMVTASYNAIHILDGTGSSMVGIKPGEEISMLNLLYCMMIHSANESANIVAEEIGGSIPNFVNMMNDFVKKIGCENTHFVNPHGLDADGQYTTANDMSKIVRYALTLPKFEEITNTSVYRLPKSNLRESQLIRSTNELIIKSSPYYYEYASGIKTGTTSGAGRCVISTASKDGYKYLGIIMRGLYKDANGNIIKGKSTNFSDCKKMFEWAFNNIRLKVVAERDVKVKAIDVNYSRTDKKLNLIPKEDVRALVPKELDPSGVLIEADESIAGTVDAPVKKGQVIGKANILYANEVIGTVDLVAEEDVSLSYIKYGFAMAKNGISSTTGKILSAAVVILIILYIIFRIIYKRYQKGQQVHVVNNYRDAK